MSSHRVAKSLRRLTVRLRRGFCPCVVVAVQIAGLTALNHAGYLLAGAIPVALPGNLVGMLLLLALLATGVVRLEWIERAAALLLRHLAFFFIPIAVGILDFGPLLRESGVALIAVLLASALFGIWAAGMTSQALTQGTAPASRPVLNWKRGSQ